jgi:hypothetical protein
MASGALAALLCLFWALRPSPAPAPKSELPPSVGTENKASILLPFKNCSVAPHSPNTPLELRITSITPADKGQFRYELLFSGLEKGTFNLTDYIVNPDGERLREPVETVTVRSLIPPTATYAALELDAPSTKRPPPYLGIVISLAIAWSAWGVFLFRDTFRSLQKMLFKAGKSSPKGSAPPQPPAPATQTLADLLRPLIEKAALKTITAEEKGRLEQIIFLYWGKFLEIDYLDSVEQLRRILEHPEAGELLRTVEQWLYQPESLITREEITAALQAYMDLPASLILQHETPQTHRAEAPPPDDSDEHKRQGDGNLHTAGEPGPRKNRNSRSAPLMAATK